MAERKEAYVALTMNTLAFTVCFACWMMNGVLVTYLVDNGVFNWDKAQIGWLIGIPVLTGSLMRLPVGLLSDRFGGKWVYGILMLLSAIPLALMSRADSFNDFLLGSLGFGLSGASFAVGIAYTSVWFSQKHQGTALGIFGAGNAGASLTSLLGPVLLRRLTHGGQDIEAWRKMPLIYAAVLAATAILFLLVTTNKVVEGGATKTMAQRLSPLKVVRVWRFGLYYFLVFGGFVALAQWLIPYYVSAYGMTLVVAGVLATTFSLPSGVIRALGGWMSDKWGARRVMYWVLISILACCALLIVPRMDITSPGQSVMALKKGTVTEVGADTIMVDGKAYKFRPRAERPAFEKDERNLIWPTSEFWQEPQVKVGDAVVKKQMLARGTTHIYFQANVWVFTFLVFVVGFMMGIGKAAVYKHIPVYFPNDVGVVGGIVGVIGGLGGFCGPILFGYMLRSTGLWTTCWMFFTLLTGVCLWWMHHVIKTMSDQAAPHVAGHFERGPHEQAAGPLSMSDRDRLYQGAPHGPGGKES